MAPFDRLKSLIFNNINVGRTLKETFTYVAGVAFDNADAVQAKKVRSAINSLVRQLLQENNAIAPDKLELYHRLLEDHYDHGYASRSVSELMDDTPVSDDEALAILDSLNVDRKRQIGLFLLALAVTLGNNDRHIELVYRVCRKLDIPEELVNSLHEKLLGELERRRRLVRSGWGVLAALVVLLLFVVTAKLLQSVIFGLIVACVLLPLEKYFERKLKSRQGIIFGITNTFAILGSPLKRLSNAITRKSDNITIVDPEVKERANIIRKSVALTALSAGAVLIVVITLLSHLAGHYMYTVRESMQNMTDSPAGTNAADSSAENSARWINQCNIYLEQIRERFEKLPPVRYAVDFASKVIRDPATREKVVGAVLKKSNGLLGFTTSILANVVSFLSNLLLTIFFALLFLFKLAEFCRDDDSDKLKSEYIVRMVFNGTWLPGADETIISEARRIIEGVFFRLRVWLKGYLTLVLVDATVYSTIFFFMDLPLFLVLGLIAGCGILLPYLGPVISCAITLMVTIAAGEATGGLLLGIVISYLLYNGIIEQFILYPAVIGEAIGLSTLETIIVVLLGAIFAGIPGMLFALPAASVAKYIVPQLYRSFIRHDERPV